MKKYSYCYFYEQFHIKTNPIQEELFSIYSILTAEKNSSSCKLSGQKCFHLWNIYCVQTDSGEKRQDLPRRSTNKYIFHIRNKFEELHCYYISCVFNFFFFPTLYRNNELLQLKRFWRLIFQIECTFIWAMLLYFCVILWRCCVLIVVFV